MYTQIDRLDRQTDRRTDGQDERTDTQTDRQTDRQTDVRTYVCKLAWVCVNGLDGKYKMLLTLQLEDTKKKRSM